jgi:hypothetical protein
MIVEYLDRTGEYLRGESLIAGLGNFVADAWSRLNGGPGLFYFNKEYLPFLMANQYLAYWRLGTLYDNIYLPPSYFGEFLMQWGYVSLVGLSLLFGICFCWLRRRIATSRSLSAKWALISLGVFIAFSSGGEVSLIYMPILLRLLIVVFYAGVYALLETHDRRSLSGVASSVPRE